MGDRTVPDGSTQTECGARTLDLGTLVRTSRQKLGLSLQQLGARVGCTRSYLSAIETGQKSAPSETILSKLEAALFLPSGDLVRLAAWGRIPDSVRDEMSRTRASEANRTAAVKRIRALLENGEHTGNLAGTQSDRGSSLGLDHAHRSGELQRLIDELDPPESEVSGATPIELPFEVPLINKVTAGYPAGFTDLGFPAKVADDYVRCPDLRDPDAFAARVVGDSMEPDYREGDIVVFSPARTLCDGDDCFARLVSDDESTFKRVYFEREGEQERIRLQPINSRYAPKVYDREDVAGLYRAVQVMRSL